MQVQNIECQIAQAQLGRYLAGEGMAGEAVRQLEAHVAKCPDCKIILEGKRSALVATLEGTGPKLVTAVTSKASPSVDPRSSASRLAQALVAKAAEASTPPAPAAVVVDRAKPVINWKPIAYASALAAVLIGMSYLGKADLLGSKASASLPERSADPQPQASPSAKPTASPVPVSSPAPVATENHATSPSEPSGPSTSAPVKAPVKVAIKPPVAKPIAAVAHHSKANSKLRVPPMSAIHQFPVKTRHKVGHVRTHRPSHNQIRVYDASGAQISH